MLAKAVGLLALLALAAGLATWLPASAGAQPTIDGVPGQILVRFKPGTPGQAVAQAHRQNGGQAREILPAIDVQVVSVPPGQEAARAAAYARYPNVDYAEVDGLYTAVGSPDDPLVGQQWQYANTGQTGGTPGADIDAFHAWAVSRGSPSVAIAVLDTGIDQDHPDLAAKIARNQDFSPSRTADDLYGHGTHVAGSVAAITGNGLGVAGTCPDCTLYNVKVLDDKGAGAWSATAKGITWAADNGAKVITLSLGATAPSRTVGSAVAYAWSKGVVVVAAAGNGNSTAPFYPAAYPNVISVAATDDHDQKAPFSDYGAWVSIAAPGVSILSTATNHPSVKWPNASGYGLMTGTSMAAPHVAGVAGLVWASTCAGRDNVCVRDQILRSADRIAGTGTEWASGRLNAYRAVTGR